MPDADEEYVNPTAESEGWQHCLTVPREVTYKNGMLYQYPVEELNGLRKAGVSVSGSSAEIPVNGPFDLDVQVKGEQGKGGSGQGKSWGKPLPGVSGRRCDLNSLREGRCRTKGT